MSVPPDLSGRTCMVTGASRGIGEATAAALAGMGAHVVLVCRDRERGEAALGEIRAGSGSEAVEVMIGDLSSQRQIRQLAADFRSKHDRLHVLINNAGTFEGGRSETEDGLETTFAVNHLAPFLLTNLLLPVLVASEPSRIVTVSSTGHGYGTKINFDDLQGERRYRAGPAYSQSKLANVLFTYELARRLEGTGVTANCLHPGAVYTGLLRYKGVVGAVVRTLIGASRPFLLNTEQGAATSVYVASSPEVDGVTGHYFRKQEFAVWPMGFNAPVRAVRSSKQSYDESVARQLWEVSEALTDVRQEAR
ncbi:MAG: SDR family oxidoreductase [Chloroflexi bacterium]|nr:SDR family oxidoreductase [Chloroflexota bacterium]